MPDRPTWLSKVEEVRKYLESDDCPDYVPRAIVEIAFKVKKRQAIRIMLQAGAERNGNALFIEKQLLLDYLTKGFSNTEIREAIRQQQQLFNRLEVARGFMEARQMRAQLPAATRTDSKSAVEIHEDIHLVSDDLLQIRFESPEDLLGKIAALATSALEDPRTFYGALNKAKENGGSE